MGLGIFFWYMNLYMQTINGNSLIIVGIQYLPLTIVGSINPFFAVWLVPRITPKVIIGMGLSGNGSDQHSPWNDAGPSDLLGSLACVAHTLVV